MLVNSALRTAKHGLGGITFAVDDVKPAELRLTEVSLGVSFGLRSESSILVMPEDGLRAISPNALGARMETENRFASRQLCIHPLVEAVHLAFSQHRPLILSPDIIWLTIAQGFGHHIRANAEHSRGRLVKHDGRKQLVVSAVRLDATSWKGFIAAFSAQIREASDPVLHETLLCDFSTTTPAVRTASEVVLMDTFEKYFEYAIECICGIPQVTVQGTPEDWRRIRERVEVLETFDLDWWVPRLRPILDEFVRTAEGNPDRDFWKAIYKPEVAYGAKPITGWIVDLFPYLADPPRRQRNFAFKCIRRDWALPQDHGVPPSCFGLGISRVPVKLSFEDGSENDIEVLAGFAGIGQAEDLALFPMVSWCVAKA
jgi:hypothetical protein